MGNNSGGGLMVGYALIVVLQVLVMAFVALIILASTQKKIHCSDNYNSTDEMESAFHYMDTIKREQ